MRGTKLGSWVGFYVESVERIREDQGEGLWGGVGVLHKGFIFCRCGVGGEDGAEMYIGSTDGDGDGCD